MYFSFGVWRSTVSEEYTLAEAGAPQASYRKPTTCARACVFSLPCSDALATRLPLALMLLFLDQTAFRRYPSKFKHFKLIDYKTFCRKVATRGVGVVFRFQRAQNMRTACYRKHANIHGVGVDDVCVNHTNITLYLSGARGKYPILHTKWYWEAAMTCWRTLLIVWERENV